MKKLLFIAALFLLVGAVQAQKRTLEIESVHYGVYLKFPDSTKDGWRMMGKPVPHQTTFNVTELILTHFATDGPHNYVIETRTENEKYDRIEMDVISDRNWPYFCIIDNRRRNIRFIYNDGTHLRMTLFKFKKEKTRKI